MALKTYTLEIIYDDKTEEIESIQEFVSGTEPPAFLPMPEEVEIDEDYWDMNYSGEVGEA
tara:strand:- start:3509 stop:3688 length:180 start_codon:yes stop_codon:yes gene_type:complete